VDLAARRAVLRRALEQLLRLDPHGICLLSGVCSVLWGPNRCLRCRRGKVFGARRFCSMLPAPSESLLILRLPMAPPVVTDAAGKRWLTADILGGCTLMSLLLMTPLALLAWLRLRELQTQLCRHSETNP
jgi:hypothetical protein